MGLGERFHDVARAHPLKRALIAGEDSVSFAELDRASESLARWLLQEGLHPGDRVAVHAVNSIPAATLFLACWRAGMIVVPVNARFKAPELAYILGHSQPALYYCQPDLAEVAIDARKAYDARHLFLTSLPALEGGGAPLPTVDDDAPGIAIYTSGTTAHPKGVTHTHRTMAAMAAIMHQIHLTQSDTVLLLTSLMHASGVFCMLVPAMVSGATVVMLPAFQPAAALDAMHRYRCTWSGALPTQVQFLVEEQAARPRDVSSLRTFICGGDSAPLAVRERFQEYFRIPVFEIFGMTESVPTCCNLPGAIRSGAVGRTLRGVEARVVDGDGRDVADEMIGEMLVRSPGNFIGYWNDPEETAKALADGWLHTGDLVRRDTDGYFWFEGRKKQIIVRGGANIAPQEVEEVLYQHPAVIESGVIGLPDPIYGEEVVAYVALREGCSAAEDELREFARARLSDCKVPSRILFLAVLPKGPTGKVQRRELKEMAMGKGAGA